MGWKQTEGEKTVTIKLIAIDLPKSTAAIAAPRQAVAFEKAGTALIQEPWG
jgi:hypothetical protein